MKNKPKKVRFKQKFLIFLCNFFSSKSVKREQVSPQIQEVWEF